MCKGSDFNPKPSDQSEQSEDKGRQQLMNTKLNTNYAKKPSNDSMTNDSMMRLVMCCAPCFCSNYFNFYLFSANQIIKHNSIRKNTFKSFGINCFQNHFEHHYYERWMLKTQKKLPSHYCKNYEHKPFVQFPNKKIDCNCFTDDPNAQNDKNTKKTNKISGGIFKIILHKNKVNKKEALSILNEFYKILINTIHYLCKKPKNYSCWAEELEFGYKSKENIDKMLRDILQIKRSKSNKTISIHYKGTHRNNIWFPLHLAAEEMRENHANESWQFINPSCVKPNDQAEILAEEEPEKHNCEECQPDQRHENPPNHIPLEQIKERINSHAKNNIKASCNKISRKKSKQKKKNKAYNSKNKQRKKKKKNIEKTSKDHYQFWLWRNINTEDYENHIEHKLEARRNSHEICIIKLLLGKNSNDKTKAKIIIKAKNKAKNDINALINSVINECALPKNSTYRKINKADFYNIIHSNVIIKGNKAAILGCKTIHDLSKAEEFIRLIDNTTDRPDIYKEWIKRQWVIILTFKNSTHNAIFRDKWIHSNIAEKNDHYKKLKIYEKKTAYTKIHRQKDCDEAQATIFELLSKQLSKAKIDTNQADSIRNCVRSIIQPHIQQIIGNHTPNRIDPKLLRFTLGYTIMNQNDSVSLIQQNKEKYDDATNLSIMSHNFNGKPKCRTKQGGALDKEIKMKEPIIITAQEHLDSLHSTKEFNKLVKIKGYKLIAHTPAVHINSKIVKGKKINKGRTSSGLAIWAREDAIKNYNVTREDENDPYNISVLLDPKKDNEITDRLIRISNSYIRPHSSHNTKNNSSSFTIDQAAEQFDKMIHSFSKQIPEKKMHKIGTGDLNSDIFRQTPTNSIIGTDLRADLIRSKFENNSIKAINSKLAHGVPTNSGFNKKTLHTNDVIFTDSNDLHRWHIMDITNPDDYEMKNPSGEIEDHCILFAKSDIKIKITHCDNPFYYNINWNNMDDICIEHFIRNVAFNKISELRKKISEMAENSPNKETKQEIIDCGQLALTAMFHISALRVYGIKKVSIGKPSAENFENSETQTLQKLHDIILEQIQIANHANACNKKFSPHQDNETIEDEFHEEIKKHHEHVHNQITRQIEKDINLIKTTHKTVTDLQIKRTKLNTIKKRLTQIHAEKEKEKQIKQAKYLTPSTANQMFKHYANAKMADRNPYPNDLKNTDNKLRPMEKGYRHFIGYNLLKNDNITRTIKEKYINENNYEPISEETFTEETVHSAIRKSKRNAAPGITAIPNSFYKAGGKPMAEILTAWFKMYEHHCHIPKLMKIDIKTPLQKYDHGASKIIKQNAEKYRPIALQIPQYKIFDACEKEKIDMHNKHNNIIVNSQAGFKTAEGTMDHIFAIQSVFHFNPQAKIAFLDMRKAFDSVPRDLLTQALDKIYKMNSKDVNTIKAMYTNTYSTVLINNKMSAPIKTHRGVQQGAISSPILFNIFINDLLIRLKKLPYGCWIGKTNEGLKINNLAYADDLAVCANTKVGLQHLLDTCTDWANDWGLEFNTTKSNTLTARNKKLQDMQLNFKSIKQVNTYKYLGVPIYEKGIDITNYFNKISRNYRVFSHLINQYCADRNLNHHQRIIMYKATVRSQIQYGMEAIYYTPKEINEMDKIQIQALKKMLKIHPYARAETILALLKLPTIKERIMQAKIKYFYKLTNDTNNSLASDCLKQIIKNRALCPHDWINDRILPNIAIKQALDEINAGTAYYNNDQFDAKTINELTRKKLNKWRTTQTLKAFKEQHKKTKCRAHKAYSPPEKEENPMGMHIELNGGFQNKIINDYIPQKHYHHDTQIFNSLVQLDNNPNWAIPTTCHHCKKHGIKYIERHKLFNCPHYTEQRREILESIITEISHIRSRRKNKNQNTHIINEDDYNHLLDACDEGRLNGHNPETDEDDWDPWLKFFFGIKTPQTEQNIMKQTNKMLMSHLHLLIMMTNGINPPNETIEICHNEKTLRLAKADIEAGKMTARKIDTNNNIIMINMRNIIEDCPIKELQSYNLGFGSAGTRTNKQKKLANIYTSQIINAIKGTFIVTDGSINNQGPHNGGCGATIVNTCSNKEIATICMQIETNDSQEAELHGILHSLNFIATNNNEENNNYTILCDCLNAVNFTNRHKKIPHKYAETIQKIEETKQTLREKNITPDIIWIPGHTDNKWNDRADELAKKAANMWPKSIEKIPKPTVFFTIPPPRGASIKDYCTISSAKRKGAQVPDSNSRIVSS